jgi:hypothetical protein
MSFLTMQPATLASAVILPPSIGSVMGGWSLVAVPSMAGLADPTPVH